MVSPGAPIPYDEALERVLTLARRRPAVALALPDLPGRVLAEPIVAPRDMPTFSSSAMDGYGLCAADVEALRRGEKAVFKVCGALQAGGDASRISVQPGTAVRIFTGAPVPETVAAIVPQEDTTAEGGCIQVTKPVVSGQHIREAGEEFKAGDCIALAGTLVTPGVVAAVAAAGFDSATVAQPHVVGLVVTGEELVAPGLPLRRGAIYDSNSFGITAALKAMGMEARVWHVGDDARETEDALAELLDQCSLVVTSGGVSVGDYDVVRPALERCGVRTVFWRVAIKPGKPILFGLRERDGVQTAVFGLPGNPVSAMVTLYVLVRPFILRSLGLDGRPAVVRATLAERLRKKPGRLEFVPGVLEGSRVSPVSRRGSHLVGTLVTTNALIVFPSEGSELPEGTEVDVFPVHWGLL